MQYSGLMPSIWRARRSASTALVMLVLLGAGSCGGESPSDPAKAVAAVQIFATSSNPRVGETSVVSAIPVNSGGVKVQGVPCVYTSSAPAIAALTSAGADVIVTGVAAGVSTIGAVCGGQQNSMLITIRPALVTLTLQSLGSGTGSLFASPAGPTYERGTNVTVTATPVSASVFSAWGGACAGVNVASPCPVNMQGNQAVTATFDQRFTLTVSTVGSGTVSASPAGTPTVGVTPAGLVYLPNTVVTLTAAPGTNGTFTGWSGACAGTGTCQVTMNANKAATASFGVAGPFAGTWVGTWAWTGPGSNGCTFNDAGAFSMVLSQNGTQVSGTANAAGVEFRASGTCAVISILQVSGPATGTASGSTWTMALEMSNSSGTLNFSGTSTVSNGVMTSDFTRSTGGTGTFRVTKQP